MKNRTIIPRYIVYELAGRILGLDEM